MGDGSIAEDEGHGLDDDISSPSFYRYTNELSKLRLEQVKLLRQENELLRNELQALNQVLEDKNTRIKSLHQSLELFVELLLIWLKTLSENESQRIVQQLIDTLVLLTEKSNSDGLEEGLHQVYLELSARSNDRQSDRLPPLRRLPPKAKRASEKFWKKASPVKVETQSPLNQSMCSTSSAETFEQQPTAKSPTSRQAVSPVPPLRLGAVGRGVWMSGHHTAGDTYA